MSTETIIRILQWVLSSGCIGAAIIWITSKKTRAAKTAKIVHDTYKQSYEDVQLTLKE